MGWDALPTGSSLEDGRIRPERPLPEALSPAEAKSHRISRVPKRLARGSWKRKQLGASPRMEFGSNRLPGRSRSWGCLPSCRSFVVSLCGGLFVPAAPPAPKDPAQACGSAGAGAPEARVGEGSARACAARASTSERPEGHARNPGFCCGPLGPPSNACQVRDCARSTCKPCQRTELVRFSALRREAVRGLGVLPRHHDYLFPETFQEEQPQAIAPSPLKYKAYRPYGKQYGGFSRN